MRLSIGASYLDGLSCWRGIVPSVKCGKELSSIWDGSCVDRCFGFGLLVNVLASYRVCRMCQEEREYESAEHFYVLVVWCIKVWV